jgi:tetratricopeptide (TPR) repeat protein
MDPRVYHFSNIIYHAINAVLVYLVALRLLACALASDIRARTPLICSAAAIAAALWGVHPLRVENVAWITERRDLVSALFLLLTVLAYLRAVQTERPHRWTWLTASVGLYVISLMAKVSGAPLAVALLALDWYPLRRLGRSAPTSTAIVLLEKLPFLAAGLVFSFIAARNQAKFGWMYDFDVHPLGDRILVSMYGLVFYAWKTIAPVHLLPLYELLIPMNPSDAKFIIAPLVLGAIAVFLLALLITRKWPAMIVAAVCYAAFLGPVLGIFQNGPQLVADRYAYLPTIGLMILLAGGAAWSIARRQASPALDKTAIAIGCVAVAGLGALTWTQSQVWRTSETLWTYQLGLDETCAVANFNYGNVLLIDRKQPREAVAFYQKAMLLDPRAKKYRNNLRVALREAGMFPELIQSWLDEAALFGADPSFKYTAVHHYDTGTQALLENRNDLALEFLTVSVALNPNQAQAFNNLAMVYDRLQRPDDAIAAYRRSIELDSKLVNPRFGLAVVLHKLGRNQEAQRELESLLKIKPDDAKAKGLLEQLKQAP